MGQTDVSLPSRLAKLQDGALETVFSGLGDKGLFSGQVSVHAHGTEILSTRLGYASREYGSPVLNSTRFNMASLGKMLTAVLAGSLIDEGKLQLSDSLNKHLGADWIDPSFSPRVTVEMLLSHTSGLSNAVTSLVKYNPVVFRTLDSLKPFVQQTKLASEPGVEWSYSNTGFELLGAVCQSAAGVPYWEALATRVLSPAGMSETHRYEATSLQPVAQAYAVVATDSVPAVATSRADIFDLVTRSHEEDARAQAIASGPFTPANMTPLLAPSTASGGAYTTTKDIRSFFDAFARDDLVSARMRRELLAPRIFSRRYRLGFALLDDAGEGYGHIGGTAGVEAIAVSYRDGGSIVLLANLDRAASVAFAAISRLANDD